MSWSTTFNPLALMLLPLVVLFAPGGHSIAQTRKVNSNPAFVYSRSGDSFWGISAGVHQALSEAYAPIEPLKAELDARPGCGEPGGPAFWSFKIPGNLRPHPTSAIVNGQPILWIYDKWAQYCPTGAITESTGYISLYAYCAASRNGLNWYLREVVIATGNYRDYCEGNLYALDETPNSCEKVQPPPRGNPVYATTGLKTQTEVDYRSADGALEFVRHYDSNRGSFASLLTAFLYDRSAATPQPGGFSSRFSGTLSGVSFTFNALFPYTNYPSAQNYQVFTSDGRQLPFSGPAGSITSPRTDIKDRLEKLTDGQSVVTWRLTREDNVVELYNANGLLTGRKWKDGRVMSVVFSDTSTPPSIAPGPDYPIKHVDGFGRELNFQYDASGNLVNLIDPAGNQITYTYEAVNGGCARGVCHRLISVQYPCNLPRQYIYNEAAQTGGTDLPLALTGLIDERGIRVGTYYYDTQNRVTSTQRANGLDNFSFSYTSSSTTETDPIGSARTYSLSTINETRFMTSQSQPAGAGCAAATQYMTYDTRGNISERKDFNGNRACYAYSTANLRIAQVEGVTTTTACSTLVSTGVTLPAGARKTSTEWTSIWRLKAREAEPLKITSYGYHGQVDPSTGTVVNCAPSGALVEGQPAGLLCRVTEQGTTDANGSQGFNATPTGTARVSEFTYDVNGKVLTANGPRTDVADITTFEYRTSSGPGTPPDYQNGDLWKVTNAAGHVTEVVRTDPATGRPTEITDPNGVTVLLSYDARGRLLSQQSGNETVQYQYDEAGNLTRVTAPDNSYLQFTYDDAARLTKVSDTLGNYLEYTLDAAGNRIAEKAYDAGGVLKRTLTREIDALGRVQRRIGIE